MLCSFSVELEKVLGKIGKNNLQLNRRGSGKAQRNDNNGSSKQMPKMFRHFMFTRRLSGNILSNNADGSFAYQVFGCQFAIFFKFQFNVLSAIVAVPSGHRLHFFGNNNAYFWPKFLVIKSASKNLKKNHEHSFLPCDRFETLLSLIRGQEQVEN